MGRRDLVVRKARNQGLATGLAGAGTVAAFVSGWWFVGILGVAGTGYLAYKWLRYRGENGLRF